MKRPNPLPLEEVSPNRGRKRYHFVSSSPTVEDKDADKLGEAVDLCSESEQTDARGEKENQAKKLNADTNIDGANETKKPTLLAGKIASVGGTSAYPKKSLGVRRTFAPWSERKHK